MPALVPICSMLSLESMTCYRLITLTCWHVTVRLWGADISVLSQMSYLRTTFQYHQKILDSISSGLPILKFLILNSFKAFRWSEPRPSWRHLRPLLPTDMTSFADYIKHTWIGTYARCPFFNQWSSNIAEGWQNADPTPTNTKEMGRAGREIARHTGHLWSLRWLDYNAVWNCWMTDVWLMSDCLLI